MPASVSKDLYIIYKMWCEENNLVALKARSFSDAVIANLKKYNLEHTNNILNSAGRRVWGYLGIEALVRPEPAPHPGGGNSVICIRRKVLGGVTFRYTLESTKFCSMGWVSRFTAPLHCQKNGVGDSPTP